jgi:hypothetical protein
MFGKRNLKNVVELIDEKTLKVYSYYYFGYGYDAATYRIKIPEWTIEVTTEHNAKD